MRVEIKPFTPKNNVSIKARNVLFMFVVLCFSVVSTSVWAQKKVTIGYQPLINPWKHVINTKAVEEATGYRISWQRFDSGASVLNAMASGDLHVGVAGSSPIAAGLSRGIKAELFWILEDIAAAEALVVRNGSGIIAPQDLIGKKIGVPFVSTTHFHLLFALEQFGITEKSVKILNLQPSAIVSAWSSGSIDAAFVWDPALGRIKQTGKVLITSGALSSWGKATFDGMVVLKDWAQKNKQFMNQLVQLIADTDAEYRSNPQSWSVDSPMVASIAKYTGAEKKTVPTVLALYQFLTPSEQVSDQWLGGGAEGGAAKALRFTSEFLKAQNKLPALQKDYGKLVNPEFAQAAVKR